MFETLAENAVRLCEAERALIYRFDGEQLSFVASHNTSAELRAFLERNRLPLTRGSAAGRVVLERRTIQIRDVREDPDYVYGATSVDAVRTVLGIPMRRVDELLGVIVIYRHEVRPFTDGQIALMETFADQAAIAIENARLLTELQARTDQLTRSVQELQALGEVGQALSSTLDLDTVLSTIVSRASQIAGTDSCTVYEYDEQTEALVFRATHNLADEVIAVMQRTPIRRGEGVGGRMAVTLEPVQVADIAEAGAYSGPLRDVLLRTGTRAVLGIPLLREGHLIGGLTVTRRTPGRVSAAGHRSAQDLRQPVGPGHPERATLPRDRRQEPAARGGRSPQVRVPGQHVARAAHAAQRHHRLQRDAPGGRRRPRGRAVHGRSRARSTRPASTCWS